MNTTEKLMEVCSELSEIVSRVENILAGVEKKQTKVDDDEFNFFDHLSEAKHALSLLRVRIELGDY